MTDAQPEDITRRVGEVVVSASDRFTAQCYRLYDAPPFGAFVRSNMVASSSDDEGGAVSIYGVVYRVVSEPLDPTRPIAPRGEGEGSEEDIYRSNPQLERLLCTRFDVLIVGHTDGGGTNQYLPAQPVRIHAFVHNCTADEVARFTCSIGFLDLLVHSNPGGRGITDEVIGACLRQASVHQEQPREFLVSAGKTLAVQLAGDLPRLDSLLKRLSP